MSKQLFIQMCITGTIMGLIYILVALGITLIFGVMRIVNFVHGEMLMFAGFGVFYLFASWHINFVLALVVTTCVVAIGGVFFQKNK